MRGAREEGAGWSQQEEVGLPEKLALVLPEGGGQKGVEGLLEFFEAFWRSDHSGSGGQGGVFRGGQHEMG